MPNATEKLKESSNLKGGILKQERITERKTKQESEDKNNKDTSMECGAVWVRDMDNEKSGYKKTRSFRNVDMEKNGKNQLDRTYNK